MIEDLYALFGVSKNASSEEIQRAYRRLCRKYHPDHNQNDPDMESKTAALTVAYAVLSDPEKRARYDTTGETTPEKSLDVAASETIMQMVAQIVEQDDLDILKLLRMNLHMNSKNMEAEIKRSHHKKATYLKYRDSVTTKGEKNFVHMVIDQKLAGVTDQIDRMQKSKIVLARAVELLESFSTVDEILNSPSIHISYHNMRYTGSPY